MAKPWQKLSTKLASRFRPAATKRLERWSSGLTAHFSTEKQKNKPITVHQPAVATPSASVERQMSGSRCRNTSPIRLPTAKLSRRFKLRRPAQPTLLSTCSGKNRAGATPADTTTPAASRQQSQLVRRCSHCSLLLNVSCGKKQELTSVDLIADGVAVSPKLKFTTTNNNNNGTVENNWPLLFIQFGNTNENTLIANEKTKNKSTDCNI
ncbi:conserved domain protein [Trichinella spiralis]|uniref:hypothetical protein n=1 Tax=Trichinella spiralis TaxID=6334 RepID=UPI0001EFE300|nr:conserved domain protein [Trichinella spiralis]